MRKLLFLPVFIFLVMTALFGCSSQPGDSLTTAGLLVAETKSADLLLQSGVVESAVLSIELSEDELTAVVSGFDDYAAARLTLKRIADNPAGLMAAVWQIQTEHDRVVDAYKNVQEVVTRNWEQYSPAHQAQLKSWQQLAVQLEANYQQFVQMVYTQLGSDARQQAVIQLLQTVAQIALVTAA